LISKQKPCISADIFLDYIKTVFRPYLVILHDLAGFVQELTILSMDIFSTHVIIDVIRLFTEAKLCIIIFVSNTTHVFQVLDLIILVLATGVPGVNWCSGRIMRGTSS
jgi:hypothetical protein